MALTTAQKISCYQLLGISYGPGGGNNANSATIHNGFGVSLSLTQMDTLRNNVNEFLDNLSTGQETEIASIITEYDTIKNIKVSISGSVGDIQGVDYSTDSHTAHLRSQLQGVVPIMHMVESIAKRNGPPQMLGYVPVIR